MRLALYLAQSSYITNEINGIVTILQKRFGRSENFSNFHRVTQQASNKAAI